MNPTLFQAAVIVSPHAKSIPEVGVQVQSMAVGGAGGAVCVAYALSDGEARGGGDEGSRRADSSTLPSLSVRRPGLHCFLLLMDPTFSLRGGTTYER